MMDTKFKVARLQKRLGHLQIITVLMKHWILYGKIIEHFSSTLKIQLRYQQAFPMLLDAMEMRYCI